MREYKRKIYLINPRFQLKMSLYVALCILISSVFYPIGIWELFDFFTKVIAKFDPIVYEKIAKDKLELFTLLAFWQIGVVGIAFVVCIFISHRIAGPLYKLKKFLMEVPDKNFIDKVQFRKGDYFKELADTCNETFEKLQEKNKNDFIYLEEVAKYLEKIEDDLSEDKRKNIRLICERLKEMQNKYKE